MEFSKILIYWYLKNKRDLPWRNTSDPYKIWLSEIILQQTRVAQGLPYYHKFLDNFPTVNHLADASTEKVMKLWQGLGYYSRARNLHETSIYVSRELNGLFPSTYKELIKLKGIGDYTASAIASSGFGEPVAAVDGNVFRVLARYFGVDTPVNSTKGLKEFKAISQELLDNEDPRDYNQAIMEFGAVHCKPQNPLCASCPFANSCLAFNNNLITTLPVKNKKGKIKERYFNYLVFKTRNNTTSLEKRTGKGIWQGLYQFPLIETDDHLEIPEFLNQERFKQLTGKDLKRVTLFNQTPITHKLTHQHIHTRFWIIEKATIDDPVLVNNINDYPVPVLIANFINEYDFSY